MNILAIETATGPCSVAIVSDRGVVASVSEMRPMMQARRTVPMMEEAMQEAKIGYGDLSHVVVSAGPGSFTGIRTGLAVARALGMGSGVACAGISTLSVLAYAAAKEARDRPLACLLNAGRGEVYAQLFDAAEITLPRGEPMVAGAEALRAALPRNCLIAGYVPAAMAEALKDFSRSAVTGPDAVSLGLLAAQMAAEGKLPAEPPVPFYIRPPDAKLPGGASA
jgi:tRNA threonylcarbamoyladenosine biosynthesis protein TsaB